MGGCRVSCNCVRVCARAVASAGPAASPASLQDPAGLDFLALLATSRSPPRVRAWLCASRAPPRTPFLLRYPPAPPLARLLLSTLPPRVTMGTRGRDLCLITAAIQREEKIKGLKATRKQFTSKPLLL